MDNYFGEIAQVLGSRASTLTREKSSPPSPSPEWWYCYAKSTCARVEVLPNTCCGIPPYNIVIHFTRLEKCKVLFCVTLL